MLVDYLHASTLLVFQTLLTSNIRVKFLTAIPEISRIYTEMYQNATHIQTYYRDGEISNKFENIFLFKRPIVKFGKQSSTLQYTASYRESQAYFRQNTYTYIKEHVEAWFEPIFFRISEFEEELQDIGGQLKTSLAKANTVMATYVEDDDLGKSFLE